MGIWPNLRTPKFDIIFEYLVFLFHFIWYNLKIIGLHHIILGILAIIGIEIGAVALLSEYNEADKLSIEEYVKEQNVQRVQFKDNILVFSGSENKTALIFYPGSNIEYNVMSH